MYHKYIHIPNLQNLQCCTVASEMSPGPLSMLTVTLPFRYHTRLLAANTRSTTDTLKCYLPRPEEHSTCNHQIAHSGSLAFTHALSMQPSLAIPLNLLPHDLLSYHLCIQGVHLCSISQLSDLFLRPLLLKSTEKGMEASSALYFWDHQAPIQIVANPQKLHLYTNTGH